MQRAYKKTIGDEVAVTDDDIMDEPAGRARIEMAAASKASREKAQKEQAERAVAARAVRELGEEACATLRGAATG